MSCGCVITKTTLWTPTPQLLQPTEILPGENMDCFARRASDEGPKDDGANAPNDKILNNFITADVNLGVNEQFKVSGPRVATVWSMTPAITGLTFNTSTGLLSGTVDASYEGKNTPITITASDGSGQIDSRQYNFCPSRPKKGESLTLLIPYKPASGSPKVTSGFGPRTHPIHNTQKLHKGQDWVAEYSAAKGKGTIIAAADGEVCHVGNDPRGYGLNVKINHTAADGKLLATTLYGHLSQYVVSVGQKVAAGQTIGKEGSTGASTGAHLHFECRLAGTTPVDPTPYYRGTVTEDSPPTPLVDGSGNPVRDSEGTVVTTGSTAASRSTNGALTQAEVEARTQNECPPVIGTAPPTAEPPTVATPTENIPCDKKNRASCAPPECPDTAAVVAEINRALNEDGSLTAEDKKLILFIAQIESRFDPYAKNPTSSATGLYQMLDKIAQKYYDMIGSTATCENRCHPHLATKAMIQFYKNELRAYWIGYLSSGKTKIANRTIKATPHSQRYAELTQGEFCYGLIHHDGVGNAVNGKDCQGVDYYRKKVRELG